MKPTEQTIDPTATRLVREFKFEVPLMSCLIDPTGRWCFAGGRGRKIYVTDINTDSTEARDDHESWVVVSARWSTADVPVVRPASQLSPSPPPLPEPRVTDRSTTPTSAIVTAGTQSLVVTGDLVGRLIGWDTLGERPSVRWSIETGHGTLRTVAISHDGKLVATGGGDGMVRLLIIHLPCLL